MAPADRVFISYAQKDPPHYIEEVQRHLGITLRNLPGFEVWTDERIGITQDWDRAIRAALDRCACAILLISSNFLASRYICERELPVLLCRALRGGTPGLIPVFVESVAPAALQVSFQCQGRTETFDLASRQSATRPDRPLAGLSAAERSATLAQLASEVRDWLAQRPPPGPDTGRRPPPPSAAPPVAPADRRPELTLELQPGRGGLRRRYYFAHGMRPTEPDQRDTDAEHELGLWEPGLEFPGEALTGLLLGEDPTTCTQLLAAASGEAVREPLAPPRRPVRVRLITQGLTNGLTGRPTDHLTDAARLAMLPWHTLTYQGAPLRQSGWTVELSPQPIPDQRPQFPSHHLVMPGPALAVFSREVYRTGHRDDLYGLFRTLWPKRPALFEAADLDQLELELRERAPRILYWFGAGRWDRASGTYLLELPSRDGTPVELPLPDLAQSFGPRAPQVCFLNLIDDQGARALPAAGTLLARSPAVVVNCTPAQDLDQAAAVGFRWLEHLLVHRSDPVIAYHHAGARCGGCWSAYQDWQTSTDGSLDDDLVEYFLDRRDQSEHLLGAVGELVNRDSPLRVQFRLAIGTRGNRVHDFARQAALYLAENTFAGAFVYPRGPVRLPGDTATPAAVDLAVRRALRLAPRADLFAALGARGADSGGELQVPLLCWHLEAADPPTPAAMQALARAVLEWTWGQLAIGCPERLRIIALLIIEAADDTGVAQVQQALRDHARTLHEAQGPRPGFKFRPLPPLAAVDEDHLRDYFTSPVCWCWDNLREEYPALLLKGRTAMPFDEAVALIKQAKAMGWNQLAEQLRRTPTLESKASALDPGGKPSRRGR